MDFLKSLFGDGEPLTYDQLVEKARAAKINAVNIADGSYVSKAKFDDKVSTLSQQVTDLQGQITQRDTDMTDLQAKLTAAQADAGKLTDAQSALTALQTKYSTDQQTWQQKVQQQQYEFSIRERANGLKFSSPAAKRDFIREANEKGFKADGETLLGYDEFVTKYKTDNPGAVVEDKPADPPDPADPKPPAIVLPSGKTQPGEKSVFDFHFNGVRPQTQDK